MTAFAIVRFRVKKGFAEEFENRFAAAPRPFRGLRKVSLVMTGEDEYCSVAEWDDFGAVEAARGAMIGNLDTYRDLLEPQGHGVGVTDAISGDAIYEARAAELT